VNSTYDCPNCGGAVSFQWTVAVFAVCPFCRSMVVRHDVNVEAIGQMAVLPPDLSPLQLGARGEFDGLAFTILGRVRLAYHEGSWNEWFALFSDNRYGWIGEAQGFFMVSFEYAPPEGCVSADDATPGRVVEISGQAYHVADRKETVSLAGEGELPVASPPGRKALSVDLSGAKAGFANLEYSETGTRLFLGRYAVFDELKFSNLRSVPGWSDDAVEPIHHETTTLNCPKCGAPVSLLAAGFTMSATCGSCGSLLDTSTPDLRLISEAAARQQVQPRIPLGRRGILFGVNYEVIGFQRVKDEYSGWFEYLLFNPWQGFVWLVTYAGHWTFVRRLVELPEVDERGVFSKVAHARFQGDRYRIFAASAVETDYVIGEFYWKVAVGMAANVTDFVAPPRILSREVYPGLTEQTWSQGEYVEPAVIQQAFNIDPPLPEPTGIYLNQPNPYLEKGRQLKWLVPLLLLVLLVVQALTLAHAARQRVLSSAFLYQANGTNPAAVSQPFIIDGGQQAVDFTMQAPVDNNWVELDVDVVNADTQQAVASFEQGIEYYHGYDDGNWSEGSPTQHRLVPGLPAGKYRLVIDTSADPAIAEMPFTVTVVRDVPVWSNFWIGLGLLLIYPLYCWGRAYTFERARWLDSDFSPYASSSSDDD
jgi:hypothetical protein